MHVFGRNTALGGASDLARLQAEGFLIVVTNINNLKIDLGQKVEFGAKIKVSSLPRAFCLSRARTPFVTNTLSPHLSFSARAIQRFLYPLACSLFLALSLLHSVSRLFSLLLRLLSVSLGAVCCNVLQYIALCCSLSQCVALYCSVLQSIAVHRSVLHFIAVHCSA